MRNYFLGIENAILFEKIPSYFIGYNFYEVIQKIFLNILKKLQKIKMKLNQSY
jgi:hypothetical protein